MAKNAHLTFDERQTIEVSLRDHLSFKEIGQLLGKDPSTISKEIRNHYKVVEKSTYNPCANRRTCKHYGDIANLAKSGGDRIARSVILLVILTVLILRNRFACDSRSHLTFAMAVIPDKVVN